MSGAAAELCLEGMAEKAFNALMFYSVRKCNSISRPPAPHQKIDKSL